MVMWEASQWLGRMLCGKLASGLEEYCADYWLKRLQECMDWYTGRCNITEILLKTALNSINQSIKGFGAYCFSHVGLSMGQLIQLIPSPDEDRHRFFRSLIYFEVNPFFMV